MHETDPTRTPPEIIFVPPPDKPVFQRRLIVLLLIFGGMATLALLAAWFGSGQGAAGPPPISLTASASSLLAGALLWRHNRIHAASRREFLQKHPVDESDPRVAALAAKWKQPRRQPKLKDVQAALAEAAPDGQPGACIVNFGEPDVPQVGELHFEPEIITPTGRIWKQLHWILIGLALLGLWLLDYLNLMPDQVPSIRHFSGGTLFAFVTWVWRSAILPSYVRMAPGIIQVLDYRYSKSKPIIRDYPMERGTLAIFVRIHKQRILTLARAENKDVISFARMRRPEPSIERAWQALLSTAPTPPLSDEDLVG
jgi:hypothetical protein